MTLAAPIAQDLGAQVTVDAIRLLLSSHSLTDDTRDGPLSGGTLLLPGPILRVAAPDLVKRLETRMPGIVARPVRDPLLVRALERAGGLLGDVGLFDQQDNALAEVHRIVGSREYRRLTVVLLDRSTARLAEEALPGELRIVRAQEAFPSMSSMFPEGAIWDEFPGVPSGGRDTNPGRLLPIKHQASNGPVLLTRKSLEVLRQLVAEKARWLAGRTLVTPDGRNLLRFAGSRHVAELVIQTAEAN